MMRVLAISIVFGAGCYNAEVEPCLYVCTSGMRCPDGLECNAQNWCAATATETCAAAGCQDWPTSNVNACELAGMATIPWTLAVNQTVTVNTAVEGALMDAPVITVMHHAQDDGTPAAMIVVGSLDVVGGAKIVVQGNLPLIVLVNGDASVDGTVEYALRVTGMPPCAAGAGMVDPMMSGGGGGGGGFGTGGGPGGALLGGNYAGAAGTVAGTANLVPLRFGCDGGQGGFGGPGEGGLGGFGGGAIQISAKGGVQIRGTVAAKGGSGYNAGTTAGGGGGGSGGAILLEGMHVALSSTTKLCANGGGGGGGGKAGRSLVLAEDGLCGLAAARGGGDPGPGSGGTGGSRGSPSQAGFPGETAFNYGSGGGGGAVGRIRINGTITADGTPLSSPMYTPP